MICTVHVFLDYPRDIQPNLVRLSQTHDCQGQVTLTLETLRAGQWAQIAPVHHNSDIIALCRKGAPLRGLATLHVRIAGHALTTTAMVRARC